MGNSYSIISELSAKDKAFLGLAGPTFVRDYFVEHGQVPNTDIWRVIEDAGASVLINSTGDPGVTYLRVDCGAVAGEDGVADTYQKKEISAQELDVTTIKIKTVIKINDLTGEFGFGMLFDFNAATAEQFNLAGVLVAGIYGNNDLVEANSSDGAIIEDTDITAALSDNVFFKAEINITATSVEFIIDDVVVATHVTNVRPRPMGQVGFAARNTNGIRTIVQPQCCEAWTE